MAVPLRRFRKRKQRSHFRRLCGTLRCSFSVLQVSGVTFKGIRGFVSVTCEVDLTGWVGEYS